MYDRDAVKFFDIAHEGAFIRGARSLIDDGVSGRLAEMNPRSLIVIAADDISRAAAQLGCALLEPAPLPIVVVSELPRFAGALDVVLVASSTSVPRQEQCLHAADRRGCPTILLAPPQGPLREEAPARTVIVPVPPTAVGGSPSAVIATMMALVAPLTGPEQAVGEHLDLAASAVDEELLAVSPERDELVNVARQLRNFAGDGRIIHAGLAGKASALAALIATWWTSKGVVSSALELAELHASLPSFDQSETDIFYDPFEDGDPGVIPLRIVVWAQQESALPHSIVQNADSDELTLENILRLAVRGMAAAVC